MAAHTTVQGHTSHTQSNDAAAGDARLLRASANVPRFDALSRDGQRRSRRHLRNAVARAQRGQVEEGELYTTGVAAEGIGVSATTFCALATRHDVKPATWCVTNALGTYQPCALWSLAQVVTLQAKRTGYFARAARAYRARCTREGGRHEIPVAETSTMVTISVLLIFVLRSNEGAILAEYEVGERGLRGLPLPGPIAREEARARMWPAISELNADALMDLALECIQAANRYAKHLRGRCAYDIDGRPTPSKVNQTEIYDVKDAFLTALLRAGRARAETYTIERESRSMSCGACGRDWVGSDWCYGCQQRSGSSEAALERWFVVQAGGYRFHQPSLPADLAAQAVTCEAHDPDQPVREVPTVRFGDAELTLEDELEVVRRATRSVAVAAETAPEVEGDSHLAAEAGSMSCHEER